MFAKLKYFFTYNPDRPQKRIHSDRSFFFYKLPMFFWLVFKDIRHIMKYGMPFNEFGVTMYCGRQGAGKTMALVEYLERMRRKYPKALIVTNFGYQNQDMEFTDWKMFMEVRNGEDGVIFAVDELQNEFSSTQWKNFPENLLSEITQQRKQKIKIAATGQVFTRVAKPLREQTFEVVECATLKGRWTFTKAFLADEYNAVIDQPVLKNKTKRLWRKNFVQTDEIRGLYDSYAKIERMGRTEYSDRSDRLA